MEAGIQASCQPDRQTEKQEGMHTSKQPGKQGDCWTGSLGLSMVICFLIWKNPDFTKLDNFFFLF
jgi:hypothetical protein